MHNLREKIIVSFLMMVMLSMLCVGTAFAGVSISGYSKVYPGRTYKYTIKVTENASSIMGKATSGGVLGSQTSTWSKDSSSGFNQSITATTTITVTIPSSAAIGSTGTITVSGQGSSYPDASSSPTKFNISGSKTITVVSPPTPPPPTAWELAVKDIEKVDEGGSLTVEMDPEDEKEINVPVEAFQAVKAGKIVLSIDYGSYMCVIDGNTVGDVPDDLEDINVGITLKPAENETDMVVFDLNNTSALRYVATYVLKPFIDVPDSMIYVYRSYEGINVLEYVNGATKEADGNIGIRVFAPGSYIVSATSIAGSEGNMDEDTFIELFATPTPEPTPVPTPTLQPTPTPESTKEPRNIGGTGSVLTIFILALIGVLIIGSVVLVFMRAMKK